MGRRRSSSQCVIFTVSSESLSHRRVLVTLGHGYGPKTQVCLVQRIGVRSSEHIDYGIRFLKQVTVARSDRFRRSVYLALGYRHPVESTLRLVTAELRGN